MINDVLVESLFKSRDMIKLACKDFLNQTTPFSIEVAKTAVVSATDLTFMKMITDFIPSKLNKKDELSFATQHVAERLLSAFRDAVKLKTLESLEQIAPNKLTIATASECINQTCDNVHNEISGMLKI
ncbi:MAG: hypothetical protein FWC00_03960 [Firmicutes bacterium]|nr:hypothetical protein [Bacillota bacterium]